MPSATRTSSHSRARTTPCSPAETAMLALPLTQDVEFDHTELHPDHEARRRLHAARRPARLAPTRPAPTSSTRPRTKRVVAGSRRRHEPRQVVFTLVEQATGVSFDRVPFESGGELLASLLGGQIDIASLNPGEVLGQLQAGELKALCAFSEERYDYPAARRHPHREGTGHRRRLRAVPWLHRSRRDQRRGTRVLDRRRQGVREDPTRTPSTSRRTACRPTPRTATTS